MYAVGIIRIPGAASQALTVPLDSDLIMSDVTKQLQGWDAGPNFPQTDLMIGVVLAERGWGSVPNAPQTELKISHTSRLRGDLLRKKKKATAKGW